MNLQYNHKHKGKKDCYFDDILLVREQYTICVDVPDSSEFYSLITNHTTVIYLKMGVSYCNKSDQFTKKIGANLALSRVKTETFNFLRADNKEGNLLFMFSNDKWYLTFKVKQGNKKVHLIKAFQIGEW